MAFGDADASTPAFTQVNTGWTTTGATTASFTPPAGSLVRLAVLSDTSAGANPTNETVTDSVGGSTGWTFRIRRAKPDAGAQAGNVALWEKYFAASPGAITVTVVGAATGANAGGFSTKVVAGCTGTAGHVEGSNTSAAMSIVQTTVNANVRVEMAGTDWNVAAAPTAGTSQTAILSSAVGAGPDTRVYVGVQNAVTVTAGTAVTMSTATPTTGNANNFLAWELVPATGVSGAAPTGLAIAVAFGTPVATQAQAAAPTGLAIPVALGTPAVALRSASPTGLAIPTSLGTPTVTIPTTAPTGLAVPVSLGTPTATYSIAAAPVGLVIPVAFGTVQVTAGSSPTGLAVPVAFGTPTVALGRTAAPTGIAVPVALGVPSASIQAAAPTGLAVPLAFGAATVALGRSAAPAGVALPVTLGVPTTAVSRSAAPTGLAIVLAFGLPTLGVQQAYRTAVLTPGAFAAATLTPGAAANATLAPGAYADAVLTPSTL